MVAPALEAYIAANNLENGKYPLQSSPFCIPSDPRQRDRKSHPATTAGAPREGPGGDYLAACRLLAVEVCLCCMHVCQVK